MNVCGRVCGLLIILSALAVVADLGCVWRAKTSGTSKTTSSASFSSGELGATIYIAALDHKLQYVVIFDQSCLSSNSRSGGTGIPGADIRDDITWSANFHSQLLYFSASDTIKIDGTTYPLSAGRVLLVKVGDGKLSVEQVDADLSNVNTTDPTPTPANSSNFSAKAAATNLAKMNDQVKQFMDRARKTGLQPTTQAESG